MKNALTNPLYWALALLVIGLVIGLGFSFVFGLFWILATLPSLYIWHRVTGWQRYVIIVGVVIVAFSVTIVALGALINAM